MQLLPAALTSPSPTFLGLQSVDCVYHRGVEDRSTAELLAIGNGVVQLSAQTAAVITYRW